MFVNEIVKTGEVAKLFGVDNRRIQQLTQEGVISGFKEGQAYRYNLTETVQQYIRYLKGKINDSNRETAKSEELEIQKLQAEVDFKKARAKRANLEVDELEGRMHSADDVEFLVTDIIVNIRSALLALPGQLAVAVVNAESAAEVSVIINSEVRRLLESMSNYKYDPAEYAKRVRERAGFGYDEDNEVE